MKALMSIFITLAVFACLFGLTLATQAELPYVISLGMISLVLAGITSRFVKE